MGVRSRERRHRWRWVRAAFRRMGLPLRRMLRPPGYATALKRLEALEREVAKVLPLVYREAQQDVDPRRLLLSREFRVSSQNGEDGILLHLFSQIGTTDRRFVEFGIQDGRECNCANLALRFGWSGLFLESSREDVERARRLYHEQERVPPEQVRIVEARVTPGNIDALLVQHGMKGAIDLLSIDIDSFDYQVWRAIRTATPRVVVIEYNASFGPEVERVMPYDPDLDPEEHDPRGLAYGASLAALVRLGREKGYALVGCESAGVNAFFVRKELLGGALRELEPAQAWYPHSRRGRRFSSEEQLARALALGFVAPGDPRVDGLDRPTGTGRAGRG